MKKLLLTLAVLCGTVSGWAQTTYKVGEATTTLTDGLYVLVAMSDKGSGPCYYDANLGRKFRYDLDVSVSAEMDSKYVWIVDETTVNGVQHITVTNLEGKSFPIDAGRNQNFTGSGMASLKTELKTIGDNKYIALTLDDKSVGYIHANAPGGDPCLSYWDGYGDSGSAVKFTFYKVDDSATEFISVRYSFKHNDKELLSQESLYLEGLPWPAFNMVMPNYVTAVQPTGEVVATDGVASQDIELNTSSLPFESSASYEEIEHWYYMNIHDNSYYLYHENGQSHIPLNKTTVPDADADKDAYTWAFVGDPLTGYKIVNRAAGEGMILSSSTATTELTNDDPNNPNKRYDGQNTFPIMTATSDLEGKNEYWIPSFSSHRGGNGTIFLAQKGFSKNRMNNRDSKLAYWTDGADGGSTFVVTERIQSIEDLANLANNKVYALQAERSPLLYSNSNGHTDKLSSGMLDNIAARSKDVNQQFLVLRTEDTPQGMYYLYSVGAGKFVAEDLTFTDYATPVLSFEPYDGVNKSLFPWKVKIGGKYVVPGSNGDAGYKIFHTESPSDDAGLRYRIVEAGSYSDAENMQNRIKLVWDESQLRNDKVYAVTPSNTASVGAWTAVSNEATQLSITKHVDGLNVNANDPYQQFAFLSVNGERYLYSYGAKKFVADNGQGQVLKSDLDEECLSVIEKSTVSNKHLYPLVVRVGGDMLCSTDQAYYKNNGGIVTNWNHHDDAGNALAIVAVDGTVDLSEAIEKIETYQHGRAKSELAVVIAKIQEKVNGLGTAIGLYTSNNQNLTAEFEAIKTFNDDVDNKTAAEVRAQVKAANDIYSSFTLNVPAVGKFYRLKNAESGNYMCGNVSNITVQTAEGDVNGGENRPATIFYLGENNTLLSYSTGLYLDCNAKGYAGVGTSKNGTFAPAYDGCKENVIAYSTDGCWLYGNYGTGTQIDKNTASAPSDKGNNWIFEEVTYLPVKVSSTLKFGTLYSPVALSTTEQWSKNKIKAYTGVVNDDRLVLSEISGDIPANTPVIVEYVGGEQTHDCSYLKVIASAEPVTATNELRGDIADAYKEGDAYVLANTDENGLGFYKAKLNFTVAENGTGTKVTENGTHFLNNGFKAYLPAPADTPAAVRFFLFDFGGEETGITEIENGNVEMENSVVYDLAGRRVQNAKKGIYVVNGKVVVK